jgi:hypothetical protein
MKVWHKDTKIETGKILLIWRHRAVGHFIMKVGSWILGAFVTGLLAAIAMHTINWDAPAQDMGRLTFVVVLVVGSLSAFFRHIYYGLHYRLTEKALVAVRPFCGFEGLLRLLGIDETAWGSKSEYLKWEEIRDAKDEKGVLILQLKDQDEPLKIGVAPVRALELALAGQDSEKRRNSGGMFGTDANLDKETIRLIVQKIREIKKANR